VDLNEMVTWIEDHAVPRDDSSLSAEKIRLELMRHFGPLRVRDAGEMRLLLKVLAFKPCNLHPDHYWAISHRRDVVAHRLACIPLIRGFMAAPKVVHLSVDGTFFYQHHHSHLGYCSLAKAGSEYVPVSVGNGPRFNDFEFLTRDGHLPHPDGTEPCNIASLRSFLFYSLEVGRRAHSGGRARR
jgi:hypothetical protein